MVIFTLHSENATEVKYEYYPEGKKDNKPGIIIIDIIKMQIKEIIPAENDFYVNIRQLKLMSYVMMLIVCA